MLNSIRELASANVQSNATQLGSFLGSTPIIRSCNEIDELLSVLVSRRSELQLSQLTGQLQLLQLFLEHAKYGPRYPPSVLRSSASRRNKLQVTALKHIYFF